MSGLLKASQHPPQTPLPSVCMCECMHMHVYVCVYACMFACVRVCVHVCAVHVYVHVWLCTFVCAYVYVCSYVPKHVCACICVCTLMHYKLLSVLERNFTQAVWWASGFYASEWPQHTKPPVSPWNMWGHSLSFTAHSSSQLIVALFAFLQTALLHSDV